MGHFIEFAPQLSIVFENHQDKNLYYFKQKNHNVLILNSYVDDP